MPGDSIIVKADLSQLVAPWEFSICSMGVFGTIYHRNDPSANPLITTIFFPRMNGYIPYA